uniref:Basic helix-loop-helix transcription factor n=2 Tax=Dianthus TaxID=3569 RepID=A0A8D5ZQK5_DIACA|nr:basic helix-loop-helix transcription factor [Dianthus caryophyllus]BCU83571.1 basic helix-loop-helix transcription factor [Dianthus sp.]
MADDSPFKRRDEILKSQLAAAVRSVHWSYAIFWSPSSMESRVLQWGDGYYNGGIKTRRTILSMDLKSDDQTVSQRSDQLRELYQSLLSASNSSKSNQIRRPLAALSPEDLTNVEWFYLVCMSFVFNVGQGLPGKCLASGQPIWLCDAHLVDTSVFSRSLLAKSAGVKTVMCFPFLDGVIELGVTQLVEEDLNIIQHVRSFLENSCVTVDAFLPSLLQGEDTELLSPTQSGSSGGVDLIQPLSDLLLFQGLSGVIPDDQLSNCLHTSMASSDCVSQAVANPENLPPDPKPELQYVNKDRVQNSNLRGRNGRSDYLIGEDLHYQNVLSSLFKKSDHGFLQQSDRNLDKKSNFVCWTKGGDQNDRLSEGMSQYMLKKILFEVPLMHCAHLAEPKEGSARKEELCKQDALNTNHVLAERRRREKVNERFSTLRSLIPSVSKADKISILDDTIAYLKELERRVEDLESCQKSPSVDTRKKRKTIDAEEGISDNYGSDINEGAKKKTRKAKEMKGVQQATRDSVVDNTITVSMVDKETVIDISCPWRETLLLQIIDAMSSLHLNSQSVHSSTVDGTLSLKIQSKGTSVSAGVITQTLLRVIKNS